MDTLGLLIVAGVLLAALTLGFIAWSFCNIWRACMVLEQLEHLVSTEEHPHAQEGRKASLPHSGAKDPVWPEN